MVPSAGTRRSADVVGRIPSLLGHSVGHQASALTSSLGGAPCRAARPRVASLARRRASPGDAGAGRRSASRSPRAVGPVRGGHRLPQGAPPGRLPERRPPYGPAPHPELRLCRRSCAGAGARAGHPLRYRAGVPQLAGGAAGIRDDLVVFFFSGHGTQVAAGDGTHEALCPQDTDPRDSVHPHPGPGPEQVDCRGAGRPGRGNPGLLPLRAPT